MQAANFEQTIQTILEQYQDFPNNEDIVSWIKEYHETERKRRTEKEEKERYLLQNFRESLACIIDASLFVHQLKNYKNNKEITAQKIYYVYQKMQQRLKMIAEREQDLTGIFAQKISLYKNKVISTLQTNQELYSFILQAQSNVTKTFSTENPTENRKKTL